MYICVHVCMRVYVCVCMCMCSCLLVSLSLSSPLSLHPPPPPPTRSPCPPPLPPLPLPPSLPQSARLVRLIRLSKTFKRFFFKIIGDGTKLLVIILITGGFLVVFAMINIQLFGYLEPKEECNSIGKGHFDNFFLVCPTL